MRKVKITREFKIGFFALAMIGLLYWGINFLKGTDLLTSTVRYYAVYDQVNGLQPSAPIVIKGFKVGSIASMNYDPRNSENIVVEFAIKSKYKIPQNSKARIFSDGIMSGKSVEIVLGDSPRFLQQGDTLHSEINKDFMEIAGSELEFVKQRANEVVNEVMKTLKNVNVLLEANHTSITTTLQNTADISGNINNIVELEKNTLRQTIVNLHSFSSSLQSKSGQIDRIISNTERFSDSLSQSKFPTMISEVTTTLGQLNTTLSKVNNGEGSLGQFITNETLYDSLVTASSNLSLLLEDVKLNPKRYVNFSLFGGGKSEEKNADKNKDKYLEK